MVKGSEKELWTGLGAALRFCIRIVSDGQIAEEHGLSPLMGRRGANREHRDGQDTHNTTPYEQAICSGTRVGCAERSSQESHACKATAHSSKAKLLFLCGVVIIALYLLLNIAVRNAPAHVQKGDAIDPAAIVLQLPAVVIEIDREQAGVGLNG